MFAYLAERPEVQERIREVDEEVGYVVESKLLAAMKRGDVSAVIFYCATKPQDARLHEARRDRRAGRADPRRGAAANPEAMIELLERLARDRLARTRSPTAVS